MLSVSIFQSSHWRKNVTATVGVSNNIEMIIETYTGVKQSDTADATGTAKAGSGTSSP